MRPGASVQQFNLTAHVQPTLKRKVTSETPHKVSILLTGWQQPF